MALVTGAGASAASARPAAAQRTPDPVPRADTLAHALTYRVQPDRRGPADEWRSDVGADVRSDDPRVVVQGPSFTWLLDPADPRSPRDPVWLLADNVPVERGPSGLLLLGWPASPPGAPSDTVEVELVTGTGEDRIDGRTARRHRLRALVQQADSATGITRRALITADVWTLPDFPFTWAPFGAMADSVPGSLPLAYPGLRARLEPRLTALGMVARAVIRIDEATLRFGLETGQVVRESSFEISGIRATRTPPAPERIVDRDLIDAARRLAALRPGRVCGNAREGDLPAIMRARRPDHPGPVVDFITTHCRTPDLFVDLIRIRLQGDERGLACRAIRDAYSPRDLAYSLLDDDARRAVLRYLSREDRRVALDRARELCSVGGYEPQDRA